MPHFTLGIDVSGAVVNAGVFVSEARRAALQRKNIDVPGPQIIRVLVDTGASFTSVDPSVLIALGITPTGTIDIVTPSTGKGMHTAETYDVDFAIGGAKLEDQPLRLTNLRVAACELYFNQGIHALVGRDILRRCVLHYNGDLGMFTLAF
jgi:predicted aspartyl protease